ncbi:MAG: IS1 family transposase [Deltaproteobacteria bacterium]|nr:IS1 family transposase [Deltaproteobacteria bacterium]
MLILTTFSMVPAVVSNATVAKPADGSFRRSGVKDPALKQQACQLYLEGMGMRAIGRVLNIHHQTVSRWLVQAAQAIPARPPETEACSFIEIDELCTFIAKKNLNVGSG